MKLKIIVVGVTHHNTLGMVRCLGMAGYKVDWLILTDNKPHSFVSYSRYVKQTILCASGSKLIEILHECGRSSDGDICVVFTCTDNAASVIDQNIAEFGTDLCVFNAGKAGRITSFMNKQEQVVFAQKVGLTTPFSKIYDGNTEDIPYPCLVKYVESINGGKKIGICNDLSELKDTLKGFNEDAPVLIQKFIKKEYEIVVLGMAVNGKVSIPGYIRKYREHDGGTNYSSVHPIDDSMNDLIKGCEKMIVELGYEGLFGIEFIYDGEDYYFIEVNLRNDATTYALAVAGANLPAMYVKAKTEQGTKHPIGKIKTITAMVEYNDIKHRKEYGISLCTWFSQFAKSKCKYYFKFTDPIPFFVAPLKKV